MTTALSIGKLADEAGVSVETIRYYQRRGLLAEPCKPHGGHRRYERDQVKRVRFIKRAQALGFTLDDAGILLGLDANCNCAETRSLADGKRASIERKMADLVAMHQALSDLVGQCTDARGQTSCPIMDALTRTVQDRGETPDSTIRHKFL